MIPPHAHSTHSPIPDTSFWLGDIPFWTAQPHLHPFHRALHFHVFQPKICRIPPTGSRFKISNQNSSWLSQPGAVQLSNQNYVWISHEGSCQKILTNHPSGFPIQGRTQKFQLNILPHHPARVHSEISQKTPMFQPELTPIYCPSRIPSQYPSYIPFTKSHP